MHYHCLLLSFPKNLIFKLRNLTDGLAPWVKRKRGEKIQASMLPCASVTSAGGSAGQSTALAVLLQTAGHQQVLGLWCSQGGASGTHSSLWSRACSQRAALGSIPSSPENLEPFSLELLMLLTPHNLQKWHSPKISQMLNM